MSEIANAHTQGVLTQSKQAISECLKAELSNKPEICKANFSVHAQEHSLTLVGRFLTIPAKPKYI